MSYFHKHCLRGSNSFQSQNSKPIQPMRKKSTVLNAKSDSNQGPSKFNKPKQFNPRQLFDSAIGWSPLHIQPQGDQVLMPQGDLPGLMLERESSMEELLNSSINQFTKYLQDCDQLEDHRSLVAQNKDLRKSLQKLKMIIKQKLVNALNKQRQELNTVMQDYVQLITKLLADKQQLTTRLEQLEKKLIESQKKCEMLAQSSGEAKARAEQLGKEREHHIAQTKQQIDEFFQIIEQYEEEAGQEGREADLLRQRITELQEQLSKTNLSAIETQQLLPSKTDTLLEILEKAKAENRVLRGQLNEQSWKQKISAMERVHEQEFMEYEGAMRKTLSKKDECIARLNSIIESYRLGKSNSNCSTQISSACHTCP